MAEEKDISRIKQFLRSVLIPFKEGIAAENLLGEYEGLVGEKLPFKKMGFETIDKFIESVPDVVKQKLTNGKLFYMAVPDDTTAHIHKLVSKQKVSKQKSERQKKVGPKRILSKESHSKPLSSRPCPLAKRKSRSDKSNIRRVLQPKLASLQNNEIPSLLDIPATRRTIKPSKTSSGRTYEHPLLEVRKIPLTSLRDIHGISLSSLMDIRRVPLTLLMDIRNTPELSQIDVHTSTESFIMDTRSLSLPSLMDIRTVPLSLLMTVRRTSLSSLMDISQCPLSSLMNVHETPLPAHSHKTVLPPADKNQIPDSSVIDESKTLSASQTDSCRTLLPLLGTPIRPLLPTTRQTPVPRNIRSLLRLPLGNHSTFNGENIATNLPPLSTNSCSTLLPSRRNSKRPLLPTPRQTPVSRNIRSLLQPLPMGNHSTFNGENAHRGSDVYSEHRQGMLFEMPGKSSYDYYNNEFMYDSYNTVNDKSYDNDIEYSNNVSEYERYDYMYENELYGDSYYDNHCYDNEYYDNDYNKEFYGNVYGKNRSYHNKYNDNRFYHNDDYHSAYGYRSYYNELRFDGYDRRLL